MDFIYNIDDLERAKSCPLRPQYHFLAPANWMNDPNAPIFYKGEYHLFYQHNPDEPIWGNLHWGHAKSNDLVYWEHLPIALTPTKEKGEHNCYSGNAIIQNGVPTIIYTSIGPEKTQHKGSEQWLATSTKDMIIWKKYVKNPIMTSALHHNLDIREWRDPYIWKEDNIWYAILAGCIYKPRQPVILLYQSIDLIHWTYLSIFAQEEINKRITWECPNFFQINGKHILLISTFKKHFYTDEVFSIGRQVLYTVGSYENKKFNPSEWNIIDYGQKFYAPVVMKDPNGRVLMWGWLSAKGTSGWSGCLTLPRMLTLGMDDKLRYMVVPELQKLRMNHKKYKNINIEGKSINIFRESEIRCIEIIAEVKLGDAELFGITLFESKDLSNKNNITYNLITREFWLGNDKCILKEDLLNNVLKLHIFIDVSIVEVFINDREVISGQLIPKENVPLQIEFFAHNGKVIIQKLDFWILVSIWNK